MFRLCNKIVNDIPKKIIYRKLTSFDKIVLSDEVRNGLSEKKPVVALESTIITHGMPFPQNVKCALDVEEIVRQEGGIPATIAIIEGQIKVGINEAETRYLGDVIKSQPIKTSRRDVGFVISGKKNGGTTVAGTLLVADRVGIPIFATGGIGGVHRNVESSFDISADLTELGRTSVAVISSGVKSILDIPKTLEYLETQGVFVATYNTDTDFPAFYSRKSGCHAPYSVETPQEAAAIIYSNRNLNLKSGMLFAVPVPEIFAMNKNVINDVIEEAVKEAEKRGIRGKEITPFLLKRIGEITGGKSLETNVALIKNNARVAASIAVELSKLNTRKLDTSSGSKRNEVKSPPSPVVIGGSNLDCSIKLQSEEIKLDGRIHFGKSIMSGGGVARNICESLSKLGCRPVFISVLGNDPQGNILKNFIPQDNRDKVKVLDGCSTGYCSIVLDQKGECQFLVGDMEIHQYITPEMIIENEETIKNSPLVVFDANLSIPTIETILKLAQKHNIPVLFEPTDLEISIKPFQTETWKAIKFITPNLNELKFIGGYLGIQVEETGNKFEEVAGIVKKLREFVDTIIVTLGVDGVVIGRKGKADENLLKSGCKFEIRHYLGDRTAEVVSVSGAGDNLASGIISGMLNGLSEEESVSIGLSAAELTIKVPGPVPEKLFGKNHPAWKTKAKYQTLL